MTCASCCVSYLNSSRFRSFCNFISFSFFLITIILVLVLWKRRPIILVLVLIFVTKITLQLAQHFPVCSWVGWGKLACWRTKATISLKRVKVEKKLLWRAYRNSSTLFWTTPSRPIGLRYGLLFPKTGGLQLRNPHPKLQSLLSLQICPIHSQGPSEQKPIKNFGEKAAWAYPGTANMFLDILYYLRNR